jgi:hypothetical protein
MFLQLFPIYFLLSCNGFSFCFYLCSCFSSISSVLQWLQLLFLFLQLFPIYLLLSCNGFRFYFCFFSCLSYILCCPAMASASVSISAAVSHLFLLHMSCNGFSFCFYLCSCFSSISSVLQWLRFCFCFCNCFPSIFC